MITFPDDYYDRPGRGPARTQSVDTIRDSVRSLRSVADAYDEWRLNPSSSDKLRSVQSAYLSYQSRRIATIAARGPHDNPLTIRVGRDQVTVEDQHDGAVRAIALADLSIETVATEPRQHAIYYGGDLVGYVASDPTSAQVVIRARLESMAAAAPGPAQVPGRRPPRATTTTRDWFLVGLSAAFVASLALQQLCRGRPQPYS